MAESKIKMMSPINLNAGETINDFHGMYVKIGKLVIFDVHGIIPANSNVATKIAQGLPTPITDNINVLGLNSRGTLDTRFSCRIYGGTIYPNIAFQYNTYIHVTGTYISQS